MNAKNGLHYNTYNYKQITVARNILAVSLADGRQEMGDGVFLVEFIHDLAKQSATIDVTAMRIAFLAPYTICQ